MSGLRVEARAFLRAQEKMIDEARARAALQLACRVDLAVARNLAGEARESLCARLRRLLERERLKGAARHWSYDLNRHIALKQALDLLADGTRDGRRAVGKAQKQDGARRRRRKSQTVPASTAP